MMKEQDVFLKEMEILTLTDAEFKVPFSESYCMKSVRTRSYSGPHFPTLFT